MSSIENNILLENDIPRLNAVIKSYADRINKYLSENKDTLNFHVLESFIIFIFYGFYTMHPIKLKVVRHIYNNVILVFKNCIFKGLIQPANEYLLFSHGLFANDAAKHKQMLEYKKL